jgi:hypothetical protein
MTGGRLLPLGSPEPTKAVRPAGTRNSGGRIREGQGGLFREIPVG